MTPKLRSYANSVVRRTYHAIFLYVVVFLTAALLPRLARAQAPLELVTNSTTMFHVTNSLGNLAAWGDYDNDGKLDVMIVQDSVSRLYHNDGNGAFHQVPAPTASFVCWVDYDNDGFLDFLAYPNQLWHNQHDGTFSETFLSIPQGILKQDVGLPNIVWFDYDHDGRLDLIFIDGTGAIEILHNLGNGQFTRVTFSANANDAALTMADFDKDGWTDLLFDSSTSINVWHNNASDPVKPLFSQITPSVYPMNTFSLTAADYNNDGLLDILASANNNITLFRNLGANTFTNARSIGISIGGVPLSFPADYDNDGRIDFAMGDSGGNPGVDAQGLYHNDGNDLFSFQPMTNWTVSGDYMIAAWGDYDNDGRLDLFSAGPTNLLFHNTTAIANTPPTAPTGLTSVAGGNYVQLSWNAATDAQTPSAGLSYNLRVGTAPGVADIVNPSADLATGWRRLPARGPLQTTSYMLTNLPPGIYYWSVQAIDGGFAGGPFGVEQTFVVPGLGLKPAWCLNVTSNSAALFASGVRDGTATGFFEWGLTPDFGNTAGLQDISGSGPFSMHAALAGLVPDQYYYFRAVVTNSTYTVRTPTVSFHTDPNALIGDLDGDGQISTTEANNVLSQYLGSTGVVLSNATSLGGGNFQMDIDPVLAWPFNLQVSSDLVTWTNLPATNSVLYQFNDPQATNSPQRYYRFR